ncbi:bacterioferritin-associated ferredoxin protein [Janthinobacterium agaricidamnosum NBRC 102515 = DSM 9628]|uniref:Bacterioferritin-associated ferredoxin protein n=2 Tax=Janthinobacterium agaricidamnosum TaxID=55508 RepID=W0V076_9BURK|nr:bacterioferritin-associated ferredoxin protein [Janthinobacterium agaricidamnosum NBRC 102515 = DSM 9628]
MAELRRDLGVATCCGKCHSCAKEVLKEHLAQTDGMREVVLQRAVLTT